MAFQLTALYNHPEDRAAFDRHYDQTHAVLAAKLPGLRTFTVSRPGATADGTASPYHLIATLVFADEDAFNTAMGGAAGQAAVADLSTFAGAGVTMLSGPTEVRV